MKKLLQLLVIVSCALCCPELWADNTEQEEPAKVTIRQDGWQPWCARVFVDVLPPLTKDNIIEVNYTDGYSGDPVTLTPTERGYYVVDMKSNYKCGTVNVRYRDTDASEKETSNTVYCLSKDGFKLRMNRWSTNEAVGEITVPSNLPTNFKYSVIAENFYHSWDIHKAQVSKDPDGTIIFKFDDLLPRETDHTLRDNYYIYLSAKWDDGSRCGNQVSIKNGVIGFKYKATATTITVTGANIPENAILYDHYRNVIDEEHPYVISGLRPLQTSYETFYVSQNGHIYEYTYHLTSGNLSCEHYFTQISPTSASVKRSGINTSDAKVKEIRWYYDDDIIPINDNSCHLVHLKPGIKTTFGTIFVCEDTKGEYTVECTKDFTTPALEMETLDPRNPTATTAIVRADINVADIEQNVGFQWKKYDAPESLKPSEGYAVVYDGAMEGYIRNLQPSSYYNVRAFYKDRFDNYYYSKWVTLDPSDFSYFEPTLHTYPVESLTSTSVTAKGSVMPGTDDITGQGFEYWASGSAKASQKHYVSQNENGTTKVFSSGQRMYADIKGLIGGETYEIRTFATAGGNTFYGEVERFTTPASSGIEDVSVTEKAIAGYYDINGVQHDKPVQGINIVLYSDGSSVKTYIR